MKKRKITQDRLIELFDYNEKTGLFKRRVGIKGSATGSIAGCSRRGGYVMICVDYEQMFAHRLAWLYVHGYMPENEIDHIDGDPSNNSISNLREASHQCNMRNLKIDKRNKSGVTGVSWKKRDKLWCAAISSDGKHHVLGHFKDKDEAVISRWKGEKKYGYPRCNTTSSAYNYLKDRGLA